jgi:hypothetical protein|tara:strand:- start:827 stop:991 length:165 start_codon:yes stop_codon:yes gene_type:complete
MGLKTYRLNYTELLNETNERESEFIVETKDINWTIEQFSRNRNIVAMDYKTVKS